MKKTITTLLVAILLVTSSLTTTADQSMRPITIEESGQEINGHKLIAENSMLEMYLKEDTLSLIIRNKQTHALMYSTVGEVDETSNEAWQTFMQSGIVLEYIKGTNVNIYKSDMLNKNVTKQVEMKTNGFKAHIEHEDIGIAYEVDVTLTEDGFVAEIPQESINESTDEFKVAGFYIYPFLGHSKEGARDGYMFIPDGTGALIYLEDNKGKLKQPFSRWIYGDNAGIDENEVPSMFKGQAIVKPAEYILAPVFGMVHIDNQIGVLGIVEGGGQYSAKIEAYPNGALTKYDWITARFIYRQVYNQPTSKSSGMIAARQKEMNQFDARIRYKFVSGEEANYTGLAKKYREHLLENNELEQLSYDFKIRLDFLGAEKENWLLFKKSVPMTTVEDVETIYDELQDENVTNILSIYKGWQKGGISGGLPVQGFNVERSIGGAKALNNLSVSLQDTPIELYLENDVLRLNPQNKGFMTHSVMKKFNKRVYEEKTFKKVYDSYNYLVPSKTEQIMQENKSTFMNKKLQNIALSGISNTLFSYNYKGETKDRTSTAKVYETAIEDYSKNFNLILDEPFSYLWKYSRAMIDMPMESSNYIFTDEDVPFLAIVLKGIVPMYSKYMNFEANKEETFLRLVEQGVYPSFYITQEDPSKLAYTNSSHIYSSRFDLYKDEIIRYYNELKALDEKTKGAFIEKHERIGDVVKVAYSNGINVYINYSNKDKKVDDLVILAKSYKVGDDR